MQKKEPAMLLKDKAKLVRFYFYQKLRSAKNGNRGSPKVGGY